MKLYNILRILIQLSLLLVFGKYLEEIISYPFLLSSFGMITFATYFLYKKKWRTLVALPLLFFLPWLVRWFIFLVNSFSPGLFQISFDINFYLLLLPLYLLLLMSWFSHVYVKFGKYEVLINGFFLFLLFWNQSHYKIDLVSKPIYLALFTILFLIIQLFVLYLSIGREKPFKIPVGESLKEFFFFFVLLVPLIVYLLIPLWKNYEEGSVSGGGGLLKSSMFRFDFSEFIKLETEISMSDDLVLMYRKEGPAERMLLRRYVLSGYEMGQGFYRHERDKINPPDKVLPGYRKFETNTYASRDEVNQGVFLVNIDPTAFLSLNYPQDSQSIENWDESSFVRIYESRASVSNMRIWEIDPTIDMEEDDLAHYTYTGEDQSIDKMASEITEGVPGTLLKTMEIDDYFHDNYFYSLKPGVSPDGDQLSYFLNESKKGYCSYFAFSMALLCRSLGIPARVAVGFWVDPNVSVLNFYPVRADQAHAWVEVYFSDYGWIEFDPTSQIMAPGEQYPFASFTIEEFSPLIEEILENEMIPEKMISHSNDEASRENGLTLNKFYNFLKKRWFILFPSIYLIYLVLNHWIYMILFSMSQKSTQKCKFLYGDVKSRLSFDGKLYNESVIEYAQRIEKHHSIPFVSLSQLYLKTVFSPDSDSNDVQVLLKKRRVFYHHYRKNRSLLKRIISFILPGPLRGLIR